MTFPALKAELELAATALGVSVAPLLQVLGSQSALRTRLVESGREPYWLHPGPRINVMPEMARVQMAVLQASMHLVGAAKQVALIVKAMDLFVVKRSRALLSNIDEVRHSVKIAILVCKEGANILALAPSLRKCASSNNELAAAAQRLFRLRNHVEGVRVRSALGQGPLTRQPSNGADFVQRARVLLRRTGACLPNDNRSADAKDLLSKADDDGAPGTDTVPSTDQPTARPQRQRPARQVSFKQSPEWPSSPSPDLYQPAVAETMPPSAWGKAAMKTRLKKLQSKTPKKGTANKLEHEAPHWPSFSGNTSFIHLPSLEVQSSVGQPVKGNMASPPASSRWRT